MKFKPLSLFLFFPFFSFSQTAGGLGQTEQLSSNNEVISNNTETNFNNEIAVNATFFIKEFLSFNNSTINAVSPFAITYKRISGNKAIRVGLGWNLNSTKEGLSFSNGELTSNDNRIDARLGLERRFQVASKWIVFFGGDLVYGHSTQLTSFDSGFDIVKTSNKLNRYGGGPALGIQFFINKRLALYTEGSMYYSYSKETEKITSNNFPEGNSERDIKRQNFTFNLPTSIFFGFWF